MLPSRELQGGGMQQEQGMEWAQKGGRKGLTAE